MAWHPVCPTAAVAPGQVRGFQIAGTPLAVYNLAGEWFATHDVCTHEEASLADGYVDGGRIECPLHQAVFDIRTGAVVDGPAEHPIRTYKVRVENGQVLVEI